MTIHERRTALVTLHGLDYEVVDVEISDDDGPRTSVELHCDSCRRATFGLPTALDALLEMADHERVEHDGGQPGPAADVPCAECGAIPAQLTTRANWFFEVLDLLETGRCGSCRFWGDQLADPHGRVIIDGQHYRIGPAGSVDQRRGLEGHTQRIRLYDGTRIETADLWHQGQIPACFRDRLPDTATWDVVE